MNCRPHRAGASALIALGLMAALNPASAQQPADAYPAHRLGVLQRATDLMGIEVRDRENHRLGRIADLVVDCTSWRVVCALVAPANFYGATEYYIAVPAKSFIHTDANRVVLDASMTNLLSLPRFNSSGWDTTAVCKSLKEAYGRFNQPLSWNERTGPGRLARCGNLLDLEVNNGDVNVGQVADWMIDLPAERVMFTVIAFYGEEENLHLAPPGALALGTNEVNFQLKIEPSQVGELVNHEELLWLNLGDPAWAAANYRSYHRELVFDAAAAEAVASTRKQVRDYVPPPPVVTNSAPVNNDTEITRKIWKAILQADIENGFLAQDMKVVTVNGKVTLTGRVGTEKERGGFAAIAEGVIGAGNVKNELQLK